MTTRFKNGATTVASTAPMGDFILPDPTTAHVYFEDFDYYNAADWTVTEGGVATQVLTNTDGGRLLISNAGSDDNSSFSNKVGESFLFETGKKLWFDCLIQTDDATQSDLVIGLQITDTTILDVTDGVFFIKNDGDATFDLVVEKDNVATTTAVGVAMDDDTDIRLSYFYDGVDSIKIFVNGVHRATTVTTNLPDDQTLTISYGVQNGEASLKTLTIDYIFVAKER